MPTPLYMSRDLSWAYTKLAAVRHSLPRHDSALQCERGLREGEPLLEARLQV